MIESLFQYLEGLLPVHVNLHDRGALSFVGSIKNVDKSMQVTVVC